jgi:hypothetical protein
LQEFETNSSSPVFESDYMNEKMKRTELNNAFKRFQRLPFVLPKSDIRPPQANKTLWQPAGLAAARMSAPADSTLQSFVE